LLYTEDALGNVTCWEAATGRSVWQVSLDRDLGGSVPRWGYTESPLVCGRGLIVTPGGRQGAIVALNKTTGRLIWRSQGLDAGANYSSPIIATVDGKRQIINCLSEQAVGVDDETGRPLWRFRGPIGAITCATPIEYGGLVFVTTGTGYGPGTGVWRVTSNRPEKVWYNRDGGENYGNHHGGVIRIGEHLYGFFDALMCIEMRTGRVVWSNRSVGKGSLTCADGRLYCLSEGNAVALVDATPDGYRERGRFTIPQSGRPSWSHPVVVGGRLFIRDQNTLTCWDVKTR
jgi:outer membrane protein assembly factor BamB